MTCRLMRAVWKWCTHSIPPVRLWRTTSTLVPGPPMPPRNSAYWSSRWTKIGRSDNSHSTVCNMLNRCARECMTFDPCGEIVLFKFECLRYMRLHSMVTLAPPPRCTRQCGLSPRALPSTSRTAVSTWYELAGRRMGHLYGFSWWIGSRDFSSMCSSNGKPSSPRFVSMLSLLVHQTCPICISTEHAQSVIPPNMSDLHFSEHSQSVVCTSSTHSIGASPRSNRPRPHPLH